MTDATTSRVQEIDDIERIGRLNRAIDILHKGGIAQQVILLGYPVFTDAQDVPTACVGYSKDRRLQYFWNRSFFDQLTTRDIAYIAAHEACHIMLRHTYRRQGRQPYLWNVACDVIVNRIADLTVPVYPSKLLECRIRPRDAKLSPLEVDKLTTEEIYDKIKSQMTEGEAQRLSENSIDSHASWDDVPEEVCESIEHEIKPPKDHKAWMQGLDSKGEMAKLMRRICRKFDWEPLLRNRLTTARKPNDGENWTRPNRKIYQWYPNVLLPGAAEKDKATSLVLFSIDTSGSMQPEDIEKMVAVAQSLSPEHYEVHFTWFDTGVYHVRDVCECQGRGGTNFNCIELVATQKVPIIGKKDQLTRYPDVVVCMTDGIADTPTISHPDRWIWIITERGTTKHISKLKSTIWKL